MKTDDILRKAFNSNYIIIEDSELQTLLNNCEILQEVDTHLSDFIRVLKHDNHFFVQEITFKKEILIRRMNSIQDTDKFVQERLDYYERKWDGCGCKIDYYE
jgi:hypothetical protein